MIRASEVVRVKCHALPMACMQIAVFKSFDDVPPAGEFTVKPAFISACEVAVINKTLFRHSQEKLVFSYLPRSFGTEIALDRSVFIWYEGFNMLISGS